MEYARNKNEGKVVEHPAIEVAVNNMLEPVVDSQILTAFMEVDLVFNPDDVDNDVEPWNQYLTVSSFASLRNPRASNTIDKMHSWLPSIRSLVGDKTERKMLIVNLLVDTDLTRVEFDPALRQAEALMKMTI
ncbi:hypothetical protein Tco_0839828 [Tanacetum coccineum]|uniref:Uncharacterized protein n=1 Tax=Tanacetum coccineum TaxID=301880 RepID=A0ABQ5ASX3_9ASTR